MRTSLTTLILTSLTAVSMLSSPVHAAGFMDPQSEGWFWYDDPELPVEKEPEPEEKPELTPPPEAESSEPPEEIPRAERPFGTAWIKAEIEEATRAAIDNPTDENIKRYLMLNRMARAKGTRFSERIREVAAKDPAIDGIDMVEANAARSDRRAYARQQRAAALEDLAEKVGLFFVHEQGPFARLQSRTMERMQAVHGMDVLEASTAGAVSEHLDFKQANLKDALSLEGEGPWVVAAHTETEQVELVATGPQAVTQLEKTLVYAAGVHGWLDEERMRAAMGANDPIDPLLDEADGLNRRLTPDSETDPVKELLRAR